MCVCHAVSALILLLLNSEGKSFETSYKDSLYKNSLITKNLSCRSYNPFVSYAPLKKYENKSCKQLVFELIEDDELIT